MQIEIDFEALFSGLVIKTMEDKRMIWDPIRKKYLVLQPEEVVRQLMVLHLTRDLGIPMARLSAEHGLGVHQTKKRFDLLVFNANYEPTLLVECKSHNVPVDNTTFQQVAWYNMTLRVPYLLVTNGHTTYCTKVDIEEKTWQFLEAIPLSEIR